jgi:hypothetical protein
VFLTANRINRHEQRPDLRQEFVMHVMFPVNIPGLLVYPAPFGIFVPGGVLFRPAPDLIERAVR